MNTELLTDMGWSIVVMSGMPNNMVFVGSLARMPDGDFVMTDAAEIDFEDFSESPFQFVMGDVEGVSLYPYPNPIRLSNFAVIYTMPADEAAWRAAYQERTAGTALVGIGDSEEGSRKRSKALQILFAACLIVALIGAVYEFL